MSTFLCYCKFLNYKQFLRNILVKISNIMRDTASKIVTITELIEEKAIKEKELLYYEDTLKQLLFKMSMIKQEINLTETIIDMIKSEKDNKFKKYMDEKDSERILDI